MKVLQCKILLEDEDKNVSFAKLSILFSRIIGVREVIVDGKVVPDQCEIDIANDTYIIDIAYAVMVTKWLDVNGYKIV